jgi:hypothetical protein
VSRSGALSGFSIPLLLSLIWGREMIRSRPGYAEFTLGILGVLPRCIRDKSIPMNYHSVTSEYFRGQDSHVVYCTNCSYKSRVRVCVGLLELRRSQLGATHYTAANPARTLKNKTEDILTGLNRVTGSRRRTPPEEQRKTATFGLLRLRTARAYIHCTDKA